MINIQSVEHRRQKDIILISYAAFNLIGGDGREKLDELQSIVFFSTLQLNAQENVSCSIIAWIELYLSIRMSLQKIQ